MIRLIVSDLDGTLLATDGRIPDANVAAIRRAHAAGIEFVVATGRPTRWLDCLAPIADLNPLVIASNGAVVYDLAAGRELSSQGFGPDAVGSLTAAIREVVPGVLFGLERGDLFGTEPGSPSDWAHHPGVLRLPLDELLRHVTPVVKLVAFCPRVGCDELASAVAQAAGPLATVTTSLLHDAFGMAELSLPGVTKASGLARLCAERGISASEVVAFGDMPNDVAMLGWAGRGYVMAGGHPALLGRFEVVPACDDSGVGRTIDALLAD